MTSDINFDRKRRRASALEKIRALLRKTVENGATEAEALAAAAKAEELIEKYDVETTELDIEESATDFATTPFDPADHAFNVMVCNAIAIFTETQFWTEHRGPVDQRVTFFGLTHDIEIAEYFRDICVNAMRREVEVYVKREAAFFPRRKDRMVRSFKEGMAERLADRFLRMAASRRSQGRGLIFVKDAVIDKDLEKAGLEFTDERVAYRDKDAASYDRGRRAGDNVALNSAVGTAQENMTKIGG